MSEDEIFRVMYRTAGSDSEWSVHHSGKGTSTYGTLRAARGAVTMFKNRQRRWQSFHSEFKIQRATVSPFWDVVDD